MRNSRSNVTNSSGTSRCRICELSRKGLVLLAMALLISWSGPVGAQLRIGSPDNAMSLEIRGVVQTRYEYTSRENAEDLSSFFMRRLRLDFQGRLSPELTFRILPELATTASLRDGYINYASSPQSELRLGQHTVPFQWSRYVSAARQHFAERGLASESFGFPTGRDVGVMFHGRNEDRTLSYAAGIYDGAGRNTTLSNSSGNMVSGRVTYAIMGEIPREEATFTRAASPNLSIGLGAQGATRNEVRAWALGRSPANNDRADWITGTADVSLNWQGLTLAAEMYHRRVSPDDPDVAAYRGNAHTISAGYVLVPDRVEAVGRYSRIQLDRDDADTRSTEWGFGVNVYHNGHDRKTRIQHLSQGRAVGNDTGSILVEHHVAF